LFTIYFNVVMSKSNSQLFKREFNPEVGTVVDGLDDIFIKKASR